VWIHPKRNADIALRAGDQHLTYEALHAKIAEKMFLLNSNTLTGLRIALDVPESFTLIEWTAANWNVGNTVLILDQRLKSEEKELRLKDFSPDMIISNFTRKNTSAVSVFEADIPVYLEDYNIERRYRKGEQEDFHANDWPLLAMYSSGSTGLPKQILRSRCSLEEELIQYGQEPMIPGEDSSVLCLASVSHAFGLLSACIHTLRVGGSIHFPTILNPNELLRQIKQHRITHIYGVLFHFQLLERSLTRLAEIHSPPLCLSSGGLVPLTLFERYQQAGVSIGSQYGMSEVGYIAVDISGNKPGFCGPIAEHHRWQLDEDGQFLIDLQNNPYVKEQPNWQAAEGGGRLLTQDLVSLDSDRHIAIQGRANRQVSIGGIKVNLEEVEQKLSSHPHIDQCCILGVDHPVYGTYLEAYLVWNELGEVPISQLKSWLQEVSADYKIPRTYRVIEEMPMSASGKILRGELLKESLNGYQSTG
jgi:acyl-coenzyme A synthetase/AMP-(fatty) acid ligase